MADYQQLPPDDETPAALSDDARAYLAAAVPGWAPSDAALETAIIAAAADEGSTLYALLREAADDTFRDYGTAILGVQPRAALPANTATTWTARTAAPAGGITIDPGTQIVVDAATGAVAFEVVEGATIPEGALSVSGVIVQALEEGSAANGATGTVLFDEPPAWVATVTLDAPATGGTDGETDTEYLDTVRRVAQQLSRAPILPRDWELLAQETAEVARALVLDTYDDTTGLDDQPRTVSIYPVNADGLAISPAGKAEIAARGAERREANWVVRVADPTYTTVDVAITVAAQDSTIDSATLAASVQDAIRADPLSPARHGLPLSGQRLTWQQRRMVHRYEVASAADDVQGCAYVEEVLLAESGGTPTDADLTLAGAAPLPLAGVITVTVIEAT